MGAVGPRELEARVTVEDFLARRFSYVGQLSEKGVIDADTARIRLSVGFGIEFDPPAGFRIVGYDGIELASADGPEAARYLHNLLVGSPLYVETIKPPRADREQQSFARWLARVLIAAPGYELRDVADLMVSKGFGVPA